MTPVGKEFTCRSTIPAPGLENNTRPLILTSASGCKASEYFDITRENYFFPIYANNFCEAGQVPILRCFEACPLQVAD